MAFDGNGNILPTVYKRTAVFVRQRVAENQSKWSRAPWDLVQVLDGDTGRVVTRKALRYDRLPLTGDELHSLYDDVVLTDAPYPGDPSGLAY